MHEGKKKTRSDEKEKRKNENVVKKRSGADVNKKKLRDSDR